MTAWGDGQHPGWDDALKPAQHRAELGRALLGERRRAAVHSRRRQLADRLRRLGAR